MSRHFAQLFPDMEANEDGKLSLQEFQDGVAHSCPSLDGLTLMKGVLAEIGAENLLAEHLLDLVKSRMQVGQEMSTEALCQHLSAEDVTNALNGGLMSDLEQRLWEKLEMLRSSEHAAVDSPYAFKFAQFLAKGQRTRERRRTSSESSQSAESSQSDGREARNKAENHRGGARVRLHSLEADAQHNGVEGSLLDWNASTGHWDVKLSTGMELSVLPANVTRLCSRPGCQIGETEAEGGGLKTCSKCRLASYCSKQCQVAAWKGGHKQECAGLKFDKIMEVFNSSNGMRDAAKMEEEGLAVAGALRGVWPVKAGMIYFMLGTGLTVCNERVKALGLLQQARELALEADDRVLLGNVYNGLGSCHQMQGEIKKAIEVLELGREITVELGRREDEGATCNNLGRCYQSLKQYDKAIELFEHCLAIDDELGDDTPEEALTRENLGRCLSRHGQHDRAISCLKQAFAVLRKRGNAEQQALAALDLGEALWAQALAEHQQDAPDATSWGSISAKGAKALQDAETWLVTAIEMAAQDGISNFGPKARMHLACVALVRDDEDSAVKLLSQHLQGWLDGFGRRSCAGCGQCRGEDTPMLSCDGCRAVRSESFATRLPCIADCHACLGLLTGTRGCMMQVLQCNVPEARVEGRGRKLQLWHSAQGYLPPAEEMEAGGQGQGDSGVVRAAEGDGRVPEGGRVGAL